jgi:hypothetical protein
VDAKAKEPESFPLQGVVVAVAEGARGAIGSFV